MSRKLHIIIFLALLSVVGCDDSMLSDHPVDKLMADQEIAGVIYGLTYAAYMSQAPVTVSGRVVLCSLNNTGNPNVRIYVHGIFENLSTTTDANGNFTINGIRPGDFTVSASRQGYHFLPEMQAISVTASGVTDVNFETMVTWDRKISGVGFDKIFSIKETNDCGYIAVGYTDSHDSGNFDFYIVKVDMTGSVQWEKRYGGSRTDIAYSVIQTPDGSYAVAGVTDSYGAGSNDFMVLKLNDKGEFLWQRIYGGAEWDEGKSIQSTPDGNIIVAGFTESEEFTGSDISDFMIFKLNTFNGDLLWNNVYGIGVVNRGYDIQVTSDNGYIVTGYTSHTNSAESNIQILKIDSGGNQQWIYEYNHGIINEAYTINQTNDNGFIVAGYTKSTNDDLGDMIILQIDEDGILQWEKIFGGSEIDKAFSIKQTTDNCFCVAGFSYSSLSNNNNIILMKIDSLGNVVWKRDFHDDQDNDSIAYSAQQTSDGGYIIGGFISTYTSKTDIWMLKLNREGKIVQ